MYALRRANLKELPHLLSLLLKKPSAYERLSPPDDFGNVPEILSKKISFKAVEPSGSGEEARKIEEGFWRAGGKWLKACKCTGALGYPCYKASSPLFDAHSCFPFSHKVHYSAVPVAPTRGADIKYPWFFTRAYTFSRGAVLGVSPPEEFFSYVKPYRGPGWYNAMEAGLRALNLVFAYGVSPFKEKIVEQALAALLYIPLNLEVGIYTSNHLMSDLYGLVASSLFLGSAHKPFSLAAYAYLDSLAYEINKQLPGWDYEGSTAYHVLVSEGALATVYLASKLDERFLERLWPKVKNALRKASELAASITLPDGTFPLIGDCGSDRALTLESLEFDYTSTITLLALAKRLNLLETLPPLEGKAKEELLTVLRALGTGEGKVRSGRSEEPWLHVYNDGKTLVTLTCAKTEKGVPPGHHHDDKGSFTVWRRGLGWLVLDPGTFTYTGLKEVRDLMRSAYFHSTLKPCCSFPGDFDAECSCACVFYGFMKVKVVEGWKREIYVKSDSVVVKDIIDFDSEMSLVSEFLPEELGWELPGEHEAKEAFWAPSYGKLRKAYLIRVKVPKGERRTVIRWAPSRR